VKKTFLILSLLFAFAFVGKAQKIDSIYFNLYTDSLKKGAVHYNYINVDGKLSNGNYIPLDTTHIMFTTTAGKFTGNVLTLDANLKDEYVIVTATLKQDPSISRQVKIYIKKVLTEEKLKTTDELLEEWNKKKKN
jgi:hypothetical protein